MEIRPDAIYKRAEGAANFGECNLSKSEYWSRMSEK